MVRATRLIGVGVCVALLGSVFAVADAVRQQEPAAAAPVVSYDSRVLADNPVAYWRLDDVSPSTVVADAIGVDAQHPNGARPGALTGAGNFGRTGLVSGGRTAGLDAGTAADPNMEVADPGIGQGTLHPTDDFTIEFWIDCRKENSCNEFVGSFGSYSSEAGYLVSAVTDCDCIRLRVWGPGFEESVVVHRLPAVMHIVGVKKGSFVGAYVNGRGAEPETQPPPMPMQWGASPPPFTMSQLESFPYGPGTEGTLDAIAFYDYALTAEQAADHYWAAPAARALTTLGGTARHVGQVSDPVDTSTGNMAHTKTLLSYPSYVYGMDLTATFSQLDTAGTSATGLGTGWTTSLDTTVTPSASVPVWKGPEGRQVPLAPLGTNIWAAPEGLVGQVRMDPGVSATSRYVLQLSSGERWVYDNQGRLARKCQGVADWATRSDWVASGWSSSADWCGTANTGQSVVVDWSARTVTSSTGMTQTLELVKRSV